MNLYRPSKTRQGRRTLILATLAVVALFAVDVLSHGSVRSAVRVSGVRVWNAGSHVGSAILGSGFFSSKRGLMEENQTLREEIASLKLRLAELETLRDENTRLQNLVHLAGSLPGVAAPVVSSRIASPYGTFMLGAGSEEGISAGDLVVASADGKRGFVIGSVREVSGHSALAVQVFAPGVSTEATVRNTPVVAEGRGGGNARVQVPRTLRVVRGDVVTSSRFKGMPIGVVGQVSGDSSSASQTLYIGLPVNLASLQLVYVIPLRT